ncbi:Zn-dependent hydrolase [Siminovitchia fortis]|uniref:Zn-dependent hydrolase n=1 Tax=Siminovitchia fortis TaxID=254758 RepID=A0A443INV0_9BACI|nr:Zn-dependent hydrolase [Siminovitchia fortis]RWR07509.1 Zn-dependent hydrolase [Siminovitchia fortis]WHY81590.1 Zn-dependent hydrolase [Siminovitchia fortis]
MEKVFSKKRLLKELNDCPSYEWIDPAELAEKLNGLAQIGKTREGGVSRFPYTVEEKQAKQLFSGWMEEIGLNVKEDAIGNLFGRLEGENPGLPAVLTGSHLDSVPNGGAFDGPLGCVSSLLAVKALIQSGAPLKRSVELVVFVDEEGARFNNSLFGSRTLMGEVKKEDLMKFKDQNGKVLYDAMKESGFDPDNISSAYRNPKEIHAFLELHIEQGKRLEAEGKNIGIVNGIAGPVWTSFTFYGETDHAGNTPMEYRKDTVAAAGEFILAVEQMPRMFSETAVATVGKMNIFPNGTNVIAGKTELMVDARDIDENARDRMIAALKNTAKEIAQKRGLSVEVKEEVKIPPVVVPDTIQEAVREAAETSGLTAIDIPSGAGHDAMIMGKYVPSGMIFVPSLNGRSHSPEEWTSLPDCVNGIQVMKKALKRLAND